MVLIGIWVLSLSHCVCTWSMHGVNWYLGAISIPLYLHIGVFMVLIGIWVLSLSHCVCT